MKSQANLKIIYQQFHEELKAIIRFYGVSDYDADDYANDFYIKVDTALKNGKADIIIKEGKVNKQYLFSIVRNLIFDNRKKSNKFDEKCAAELDIPCDDENERHYQIESVKQAIAEMPYWFDKKILMIYFGGGYTIRSLAKETHISRTTIHQSIKKSKQFIKSKLKYYD